jgi:hypothetical protein
VTLPTNKFLRLGAKKRLLQFYCVPQILRKF